MRTLIASLLALVAFAGTAGARDAARSEPAALDAESLWWKGHRGEARQAWSAAREAAAKGGDRAAFAAASSGLAFALAARGERAEALRLYAEAEQAAREARDMALVSAIQGNRAWLLALEGDSERAEALLQQALDTAPGSEPGLRLTLKANLVRVAAEAEQPAKAALWLAQMEEADASDKSLRARLAALQAAVALAGRSADAALLKDEIARQRGGTETLARRLGDPRLLSVALGVAGQALGQSGDHEAALAGLREATALAQRLDAPELLFRWQWEAGRVHAALGRRATALRAYQRAVASLQKVRQDLGSELAEGMSFRALYGPLYYELADLLLREAAGERDAQRRAAMLEEARSVVELSKAAELEDYFNDGCVAAHQARVKRVESVASDVAFVYPLILADRLELLVSHAGGTEQFVVPVDRATLVAEVRRFRLWLQQPVTAKFLQHSRRLYGWLLAPIEPRLQALGVRTIVTVPEGVLRTIPFAALHDGSDYVVRRYSFATTPGVALTDPTPLPPQSVRVLLSGLTEAVQGFEALPNVENELRDLGGLFPGRVLKNRDFGVAEVEKELSGPPYSVLHIASHAQFSRDAKQTFLLTYREKVTMDRLEKLIAPSRFRDQPIELLTLSACQTAAGDERAALGLAGVAIKAGARSALASLWLVNDESTAVLVTHFYQRLAEPGTTKAEALRRAQLKLLDDARYSGPAYWAAFLLIGNWL